MMPAGKEQRMHAEADQRRKKKTQYHIRLELLFHGLNDRYTIDWQIQREIQNHNRQLRHFPRHARHVAPDMRFLTTWKINLENRVRCAILERYPAAVLALSTVSSFNKRLRAAQ